MRFEGSRRTLSVLVVALGALVTAPRAQDAADSDATRPTLVVGTKEVPPFAIRAQTGEGNDAWRGISIELWKRIARKLDLDYRFVEKPLDELVSGLESEAGSPELDASVAALTVTPERELRIDFTHPFHPSGLGIAVPAARRSGLFWNVLAAVFSSEFLQGVLALAAILLVTGGVVWWLERGRNDDFGGSPAEGLGNGFWWSATTMTTVGYGDKAPKTFAGRAVAIIWMFASVITISGFTAAIASSLTVSNLSSSIRGPEDLPKVRVATVADSTSATWLRARGISTRTFPDVGTALDALASGDAGAVVYDAPLLRYAVLQRDDSKLGVLPNIFERQDYAIGLPLGSERRKEINAALIQVVRDRDWQIVLDEYLGSR
jgi:polar amino acid transport system substrate-binding protein